MLSGFAGVTDPGRRRRRNEDAYVAVPPLFAIADGMGGAQAGEVASGLAAAVLEEATGDERGEDRVASLIQEANRRVFQRSTEDAATSGMGTTMTVALLDNTDGTIAFGHVGDSRAYRVRGGELEQLTDDHSLVGELVRSGRLSPEEAESHPQRSVITRALGTEPDVDVDTFTVEAEPGDIYLLCSDGLTDMASAHDILTAVESNGDLDEAARALVGAANAGGGEDNITVVLFELLQAADGVADEAALPAAAEEPVAPDPAEPTSLSAEVDTPEPGPDPDSPEEPEAAPPQATRHGAGPGGRIAALLLLAALLAIAILALYTGINR
jgi:PPM family protein phosphatase